MRILYVGNFDTLSVGEPEIASSLEELGHQVDRVHQYGLTVEELKERLGMRKYDLFLFAKLHKIMAQPIEVKYLLDDIKIPKACWIFDIYFGL